LINSKEENAYFVLFRQLKDIVTDLGLYTWDLKHATIDFEEGLQIAFERVFSKVTIIGCLFHYRQALLKQAQGRRLTTEAKLRDTQILMDKLSSLSWSENKNQFENSLLKIKEEYSTQKEYQDFIIYFEKNWYPRFKSGQIKF